MPAQISVDKLINATLKGLMNAQNEYETWSGGYWLGAAPEYLSTVYVAREIAKLDGPKFLTLETSARYAIEDAGAKGRGKLHRKIRANGRFDILLGWANDKPRAPIEIKGYVQDIDKIADDIKRIEKVINRKKEDSSFQFGMVTFHTSCCDTKEFTAKERIERRISSIADGAKSLVGCNCKAATYSSRIKIDEDYAWAAIAIVLKPT